ncbi:MAG: M23 family metallopeptidase [Desulfuromonadaceae bacterium]|nr:M23 family metallopeptidase [Desulfuromonadaceae bacterium]
MKAIRKLLTLFIFIAIAGTLYLYFRDTSGPDIQLTPQAGFLRHDSPLQLQLQDQSSQLKSVQVVLHQGEQQISLLKKDYPEGTTVALEDIILDPLLQDGPLTIEILARDRAYYHFGEGNQSSALFTFTRDCRPPMISVLSTAHNLNQGGAGLITYRLSEPVTRSGIEIGNHFFPGFQQSSGDYVCLFAFPYDVPADSVPRLVATDEAGNRGLGGFYYHLNRRAFRRDRIGISDGFLNTKMPQFQHLYPQATTPLEIFLKVNRELRPQNRARLQEIGLQTAPSIRWDSSFLRQPNAANRAQFGDVRSYEYQGKKIDEQTHLGIDLASTAQAPVPASNEGAVVFAGFMGIYGNCVMLDHGLGLQTLYAHLSRIDVAMDDLVQRGQIIGTTGATGMAGGDHLHFGVIISGVPVNPVEWWDRNWLQNNILSKLDELNQR